MFGITDTVQNFDLKLKYLKTYPGIFFFFLKKAFMGI